MGAPPLDKKIIRRLKQIDKHFNIKWDHRRNRWLIIYHAEGRRPTILMAVRDENGKSIPIDGRTFDKLRKLKWYNNRLFYYMKEMEEADRKVKESKEKSDQDYYRQVGLAMRRPIQMLARQMGVLSGKSKIPYSPGFR